MFVGFGVVEEGDAPYAFGETGAPTGGDLGLYVYDEDLGIIVNPDGGVVADPGVTVGDPGSPADETPTPSDPGPTPVPDPGPPPPPDPCAPGLAACAAGSVETDTQSCGACGSQSRTRVCTEACQLGAWSDFGDCGGQGECSPGQVETDTATCNANSCGQKTRTRSCSEGCTWGGWSDFGVCEGGMVEADASPDSPVVQRFDLGTMSCGQCGAECAPDAGPTEDGVKKYKCLCQAEFMAINYPSPHLVALGAETYRKVLWAQGNFAVVYVNEFISGYKKGGNPEAQGAAMADAIFAQEQADWPSLVPSWFLVNEISASLWPADSDYRDYVVAVAKQLKNVHGRKVVIFSPFATPGNAWPQWASLAAVAFVGAESYAGTTGKQINASGNSVAYVKGEYQATLDAYAKVGVAKNRVFITEHYGNTDTTVNGGAACTFGRCGVGKAGWLNAIEARGEALKALGLSGVVTYGWDGNAMQDTSATRIEFVQKYAATILP